jgi:hypothetical protein
VYFTAYLLQSNSLGFLHITAYAPAMPGSISENHSVKAFSGTDVLFWASSENAFLSLTILTLKRGKGHME